MHENLNNPVDLHTLQLQPTSDRKSIALVSIHKTASSYFSAKVVKQVSGMISIDYQSYHYRNGGPIARIINPAGYIYGVLRFCDDEHPAKELTDSIIDAVLRNDLDIVILIRDPRDVIVSMYYSFGFSHGISADPATRLYQLKRREMIQSMCLDEYAVSILPRLKSKLDHLIRIKRQEDRTTILKYETMIVDFKSFFRHLQLAIPVDSHFESTMYADTRPQAVENISLHRRSGAVGGYKTKLREETVARINDEIRDELSFFGYL